jgi:hypothetical protein
VGFLCNKKENVTNRSVNGSKGEKLIKNIYRKPQWGESLKNKTFGESFFPPQKDCRLRPKRADSHFFYNGPSFHSGLEPLNASCVTGNISEVWRKE